MAAELEGRAARSASRSAMTEVRIPRIAPIWHMPPVPMPPGADEAHLTGLPCSARASSFCFIIPYIDCFPPPTGHRLPPESRVSDV